MLAAQVGCSCCCWWRWWWWWSRQKQPRNVGLEEIFKCCRSVVVVINGTRGKALRPRVYVRRHSPTVADDACPLCRSTRALDLPAAYLTHRQIPSFRSNGLTYSLTHSRAAVDRRGSYSEPHNLRSRLANSAAQIDMPVSASSCWSYFLHCWPNGRFHFAAGEVPARTSADRCKCLRGGCIPRHSPVYGLFADKTIGRQRLATKY